MECPMCESDEFIITDEFEGYIFYECLDCHCAWSVIDDYVEEVFYEGY